MGTDHRVRKYFHSLLSYYERTYGYNNNEQINVPRNQENYASTLQAVFDKIYL